MENKGSLGVELRQIIQVDRTASQIVRDAQDVKKNIEAETEKRKNAIIEAAAQSRAEMLERIKQEQAESLAAAKAQIDAEVKAARSDLDTRMENGRKSWIEGIVERITVL